MALLRQGRSHLSVLQLLLVAVGDVAVVVVHAGRVKEQVGLTGEPGLAQEALVVGWQIR